MVNNKDTISFKSHSWDNQFNRVAGKVCENFSIGYATQCRILNWEKTINTFLILSKRVINGSFILGIEDYGNVEISANCCKKTTKKADLLLNRLDAARFLFGNGSPENICMLPIDKEEIIKCLLPLQFGWNGQDRV